MAPGDGLIAPGVIVALTVPGVPIAPGVVMDPGVPIVLFAGPGVFIPVGDIVDPGDGDVDTVVVVVVVVVVLRVIGAAVDDVVVVVVVLSVQPTEPSINAARMVKIARFLMFHSFLWMNSLVIPREISDSHRCIPFLFCRRVRLPLVRPLYGVRRLQPRRG